MSDEDFFSIFGLSRSFSLDVGDLEKRFYALSRELHPDRFATRPASERADSMDRMSLLNRAYGTLKSPAERRLHLLRLEGVLPVGREESGSAARGNPIPTELAESWFEIQEALAESSGPESRSKLAEFASKLEDTENKARAEISALESQYDANGSRGSLEKLAELVRGQGYLASLRRDLERLRSKSGSPKSSSKGDAWHP